MQTIRLLLADISYYLSNEEKHLCTFYSQKHFTFCSCILDILLKTFNPSESEGILCFCQQIWGQQIDLIYLFSEVHAAVFYRVSENY